MEHTPSCAWINGCLVPWAEAVVPVEDRGLQFAESLYEVVPVSRGEPRLVSEHAARMRRGAEVLELGGGVPATSEWARLARRLIAEEGVDEGLLYAQLTGGTLPRRHLPGTTRQPTFFAFLRRFRFPREAEARRGLRVITIPDTRWARCDLKTTMLLPSVMAKREVARRGADEALLVAGDGELREGASSNLLVVHGRRVLSPARGHHLLAGITCRIVLELALEHGLEVAEARVVRADLESADEVLLTATTLLVMPVLAVDHRAISGGSAGPVGLELARRLRARLEL